MFFDATRNWLRFLGFGLSVDAFSSLMPGSQYIAPAANARKSRSFLF